MKMNKKRIVTSKLSHRNSGNNSNTDEPVIQQVAPLRKVEPDVRWLPILVVSIYFASLWKPPVIIEMPSLKWYLVLGLAIFAFLVKKKPLDMHSSRVFWIIYGLSFLGAVMSLLRANNMEQALWNTVGMGISFVTYLLFLPVLALRRARKFLLFIIVGIGILWAFEIQRLLVSHGALYLGTFGETGEDKNLIGFCLSLASVSLFYMFIMWKAPPKISTSWSLVIRIVFGMVSIYLFYNLTIIYARSSFFATILGFCSILIAKIINSQRWTDRWRVWVILIIFITGIILLWPKILAESPQWNRLGNFESEGLDVFNTYNIRVILIKKGLFLVSENPFLGVGVGGSRAAVSSSQFNFPQYFIHNAYLTDWAEKGIFGLISNVVWIFMYIKLLRRNFFGLPTADQIWLLLFIPLFFELSFIDIGSISMTMLVIFAGIYYEQYQIEKA
jgi:hypothetical protein